MRIQPAFHPRLMGQVHHLGQPLHVSEAAKPQFFEIAVLQQFQREGDERATHRRRRIGEDARAGILHPQRCALVHLVIFEIAPFQVPALIFTIAGDPGGHFAAIKQIFAFCG